MKCIDDINYNSLITHKLRSTYIYLQSKILGAYTSPSNHQEIVIRKHTPHSMIHREFSNELVSIHNHTALETFHDYVIILIGCQGVLRCITIMIPFLDKHILRCCIKTNNCCQTEMIVKNAWWISFLSRIFSCCFSLWFPPLWIKDFFGGKTVWCCSLFEVQKRKIKNSSLVFLKEYFYFKRRKMICKWKEEEE